MMNNQTDDKTSIRYFNIYINLFYLIFGNIGNLFKVAFFLQKPLRSVPCTIYILCATCSDFITLNNLPIRQLLIHLYPNYHWIKITIDWSNYRNETILLSYSPSTYDITMCKIRSYLHMFSTDLSFHMLLFASINRFFIYNHRKKRKEGSHYLARHFCDHLNVYRLCIITSILYAFLSLQHAFNFTVISPSEGCIPYNYFLWSIWVSLIHCFLLPTLIIVFGILTLRKNHYLSIFSDYIRCLKCYYRRQIRHRCVAKCSCCQKSIQHKVEKQLTAMIISEICVTVLTSVPYGVYTFYHFLQHKQETSIIDQNHSAWLLVFIRMSIYFEPSCGFFIYLFTLGTMKKRFFKMIRNKIINTADNY